MKYDQMTPRDATASKWRRKTYFGKSSMTWPQRMPGNSPDRPTPCRVTTDALPVKTSTPMSKNNPMSKNKKKPERIQWGRIKCNPNTAYHPYAAAMFELPEDALDAIPVVSMGGDLHEVKVEGRQVSVTFTSPRTCLTALLYTVKHGG